MPLIFFIIFGKFRKIGDESRDARIIGVIYGGFILASQ